MIRLEGVSKVFNQGRPNEYTAVDAVTLELQGQQMIGLRGPSGSGKTTLLSIIGCMTRPTAGRLWLHDREISSLPERFLTQIRRRTFGFVFQHFNLIPGITALENVMIPAYPAGEPFPELRARARERLAQMGMEHKAESRVEWLSGGEAQRVAIARALINAPEVVVADEPTAHLDTRLAADFVRIIADLRDAGTTVLVASHDALVFGSGAVDRVVEMVDGRVEGGSP